MPNILDKIIKNKIKEITTLKEQTSIKELEKIAIKQPKPLKFVEKLITNSKKGYGLITEIKRASPSKGLIRKNFKPEKIAQEYKNGGASCISVLTDEKFFMGSIEIFKTVRKFYDIPILRKDFIIDPIQIYQSRSIGADCILLMLSCLSDKMIKDLFLLSQSLSMDVLIEVHDETELNRALEIDAPMIGINNRNLKTMETSLNITKDLLPKIPKNKLIVSESGFDNRLDLEEIAKLGVRCFLIGETLMKSKNIEEATLELLKDPFYE